MILKEHPLTKKMQKSGHTHILFDSSISHYNKALEYLDDPIPANWRSYLEWLEETFGPADRLNSPPLGRYSIGLYRVVKTSCLKMYDWKTKEAIESGGDETPVEFTDFSLRIHLLPEDAAMFKLMFGDEIRKG
jgi:hypothetical protein